MSKKRARREKWTDKETNALLRMRTAGIPYREIAMRLKRGEHACVQRYNKVKDSLPKNSPIRGHAGMGQTVRVKVDDKYNPMPNPSGLYDPKALPFSTERNNKSWTRKEDRLLKSMVKNKATMHQLMRALKRTDKAIDSRIRTLSKKKTYKPRPTKVETATDIGIENFIGFIRGLQEENKQLRAKLESIRNALK